MVDDNWNEFKAFGGTLDRTILHKSLKIEEDIDHFYTWLQDLKADPLQHGIPSEYLEDVGTIFEKFLVIPGPTDAISHAYLRPLLETVSTASYGDVFNGNLVPVTIHFGSKMNKIDLIDGASALAYLFSIQTSPLDADWHDYWFPMLLYLSKCLYLAFARDHTDLKTTWSGVPVMACVMYLPPEIRKQFELDCQPFMFGSSVAAAPSHEDQNDLFVRNRRVSTIWRGERVLADTLASAGTGKRLPELCSASLEVLSKQLHNMIIGKPNNWRGDREEPLIGARWKPLNNAVRASIGSDEFDFVVPPGGLLKNSRTESSLRVLLVKVIRAQYAAAPQTSRAALDSALQELITYYASPKVYRKDPEGHPEPSAEPLDDNQKEQVRAIVKEVWQLARRKLDLLRSNHEIEGGYSIDDNITGRCAEAYPTTGIGPKYFPSMEKHMKYVHGLAIEARGIGVSSIFNQGDVSLANLKKIPKANTESTTTESKNCCRFPCDNCRIIMALFGIETGVNYPAEYDKDMIEADVAAT